MALITGIVFGFMLALVGVMVVGQTYGIQTQVDNPLAIIPFQPKTIDAGITIENLGWQIFSGILLVLVIFIIVLMALMMFLVKGALMVFMTWTIMLFVSFTVFFWIGTMIVGMTDTIG